MNILPAILIFIAVVILIEGIALFVSWRINPEKRRINQQLSILAKQRDRYLNDDIDITRKSRELSSIPWLNRLLQKIPHLMPTDRLIEQAGAPYTMGVYILSSVLLFVVGTFLFYLLTRSLFVALPIGLACGYLPFLYLVLKKSSRMKKFEAQLPDALDLMARALKAGHAFPGGLQMVAREFDAPIGDEFSKAVEEINFGVGVEEALRNMTQRVDGCPDLKFFAIAVMIQRETGGNLAEILESIARVIRERFKLLGTIRTLSAEGRLSAWILGALPFLLALYMMITNPSYINVLSSEPMGRILVLVALTMMAIGIYVMKKLIQIKV